jgi:transposase
VETRRRWSEAEKQAILEEVRTSGTTLSAVARKHGLSRELVFRWRREARAKAQRNNHGLVPVLVAAPGSAGVAAASAAIEIVLAGNRRVIVGSGVDPAALKQVIAVLEGR